jgi:hypothetical protein
VVAFLPQAVVCLAESRSETVAISSAVYDPPSPEFPYVAIVVVDRRVVFAEAVPTPYDGEIRLAGVLADLAKPKDN